MLDQGRARSGPGAGSDVEVDALHGFGAQERVAAPRERKPLMFWESFNAWWRGELNATGLRPDSDQIARWYQENADSVWGVDKPSLKETRTHAKCLRSVNGVRDYFRAYRASKRGQDVQEFESHPLRSSVPPQPKEHTAGALRPALASKRVHSPEPYGLKSLPQGPSADGARGTRAAKRSGIQAVGPGPQDATNDSCPERDQSLVSAAGAPVEPQLGAAAHCATLQHQAGLPHSALPLQPPLPAEQAAGSTPTQRCDADLSYMLSDPAAVDLLRALLQSPMTALLQQQQQDDQGGADAEMSPSLAAACEPLAPAEPHSAGGSHYQQPGPSCLPMPGSALPFPTSTSMFGTATSASTPMCISQRLEAGGGMGSEEKLAPPSAQAAGRMTPSAYFA